MATLKEHTQKFKDSHQESMSQSSPLSAIAAGLTIEMLATLFLSIVISIYAIGTMIQQRTSIDTIWAVMMNPLSPYAIVANSLGALFSILAGYTCAHLINRHEYRYTLLMGVIMAILVVVTSLHFNATLLISVLQIPAILLALFGAWLHITYRPKQDL